MANSAISSILKKVDEVLSQEINLLGHVRPEFESLQGVLRIINASLADFDRNRAQVPAQVEELVQQLREAALEAGDIIDDFYLMIDQKKLSGIRGSLMSFLICVSESSARHELVDESPSSSSVARCTSELDKAALSQGLSVVGFAEAERSMREQLLNWKGKLAVISLVGIGGIGKTTISKVYNHDAVDGHFGYRAWVNVSQKFTPTEVIRSLTDMRLVEKLKARLKKVRYLVIIDDIWEKEAWDLINSALPPSPGSRVMLTTRIDAVAKVCPERNPQASLSARGGELGAVLREGVSRRRGVPPGAGGGGEGDGEKMPLRRMEVLRRRLTEKLSADRNEMIKNILALSYDDLSNDLKICFRYIGLFPEDMEIDATKLVQLWVAEGFIVQARGLTLKETAEQHLEQLANRSALQVVDRDPLGRVDKCRIHDLLLDLAKDEGGKNQFVEVHEGLTPTHAVRSHRLAVHENASFCLTSSSCLVLNLRSLLCFNLHGQELSDSFVKLCSLKLLRVIVSISP
ncbi:unnamed protein product [Spirodela intermedia]|uniref:Uncharacterized protein n=1 Tax=Spirodela intermedia TaxID=51605 RepID=A0A7I8LE07_SPIIN|nr:unnamed protein product [Spirodela intermedia]